jgi:hypothetical protein
MRLIIVGIARIIVGKCPAERLRCLTAGAKNHALQVRPPR